LARVGGPRIVMCHVTADEVVLRDVEKYVAGSPPRKPRSHGLAACFGRFLTFDPFLRPSTYIGMT
jgi:hypothetical protein